MSVGEQETPVLYGLFPTTKYTIQYSVLEYRISHSVSLSLPVYLFDELAVDLIT